MSYVHLHVHTSRGSALDGMSLTSELIDRAKSLGQKALAISDHGSMSALWEAQQHGDSVNMKIIHACEFYYQYDEPFGKKEHGHLLILAKNDIGLRNMFRMHQWASRYNFKRKARITWEMLKQHAEGLIVTSACLGSEFNQFIMAGRVAEAKEWAKKFKETFGSDFYIELQPNALPEQQLANSTGIRIARELGIELVATNDVHYTFEDDCYPHEVLLAMQFNNKMSSEKRFRFPSNDFWLKSESEMYETFTGLDKAIAEEAINNTTIIADKCNARIEKGHYLTPFHTIPEGKTERQLLVEKILEGSQNRGLSKDRTFMEAVQHEVNVIDRNGYSGYFMVVQDFVVDAKKRGELVGDGRGSGAGSKVAYLSKITEIPPHDYDLLFERFMADGREPKLWVL